MAFFSEMPFQSVARAEDIPATSISATDGKTAEEVSFEQPWPKSLSVGLNLYQFEYAEDLSPPYKSTEYGLTPGIQLMFQTEPSSSAFLRGLLNFNSAESTYDGSTQKGEPIQGATQNSFFSLETDAGLSLYGSHFSHAEIKVYLGLGFRTWGRGTGYNVIKDSYQFREEYSWFYLPIGFMYEAALSHRWQIAIDAAVIPTFGGKMVLKTSNILINGTDPSVQLGNRVGYRIQAPLSYQLNPGFAFFTNPWFEYSAIGRSNDNTLTIGDKMAQFSEPSSSTRQYGFTTGVALHL